MIHRDPESKHANLFNALIKQSKWGYLPVISVVGSIGVMLISVANSLARYGVSWVIVLFWIGLLLLVVPITARLISEEASRPERIGLVIMLGIGLYLVKLLHSPVYFTFHDEFAHWRTASDIVKSHHLFSENSLIPVSPLFPGLEIATNALVSIGGFSIYSAGIVLIGVARILLILALYLLFEQVSGSERVAGLASALYMANSNFVFWGSQFAYESLALPIAVFVLYITALKIHDQEDRRVALALVSILGLGAVVITHHITSYALVVFLALLTVAQFMQSIMDGLISWYSGEKTIQQLWLRILHVRAKPLNNLREQSLKEIQPSNFGMMLLSAVVVISWFVFAAIQTINYLVPVLAGGVIELYQMMVGEAIGRRIFYSATGQVLPVWERFIAYTAVVFILLGLPFGLNWIWKRHRSNVFAFALGLGALAYPVSLVFRFTNKGWEISNRASEFLFVPIAFVLAICVVDVWLARHSKRILFVACVVWATVIFMGGIIAGWPPWARLPGPYLVAADTRSIDLEGLALAQWVQDYLGPDNRMVADRTNAMLIGSYGEQRIVNGVNDGLNPGSLFFAEEIDADELAIIQQRKIRYLVIDRRLSSSLPMLGIYVEVGEPNTYQHKAPIDKASLEKFDDLIDVDRIFESNNIVIYDLKALSNEP